jgi:hypothetical protein
MIVTFVRHNGDRGYYYTMHDYQSGLFGTYTLTVIWGPYIETGRRRVYTFESRGEMDGKLRELVHRRFSLGYSLLYSYSRYVKYRRLFGEEENVQEIREARI